MGAPVKSLESVFTNLNFTDDTIILELGSGTTEGSTEYLYNYSKKNNVDFYSIDVVDKTKLELPHVNCIVYASAEDWCKQELPKLNKKIKILYLDNFDWYYWGWEDPRSKGHLFVKEQCETYAKRGVSMTRENSMTAHRIQAEYCLPFMDDESIIIMDDTFFNDFEDLYFGKCATVIPLVKEHGYSIHQIGFSEYIAYRNCNP